MVDLRAGTELKVRKENSKRDHKAYMKYLWIETIRRTTVFLGVITIASLTIHVRRNLVIKALASETAEVDILNCQGRCRRVSAPKWGPLRMRVRGTVMGLTPHMT